MIWKLGPLPLTPPPLHLLCKRKLHNKIKPPYVRLSSSWHKGRFKHVCLHFQNNLNCLQVCIRGRAKNLLSIYQKINFYTFPPWFVAMECCLCMICGQRWKAGHLDWGGQKDQIQPSLNGRGLLGFSYGRSSKLSLDRSPTSSPSVVLWHPCQFVSTQPDFTNTQI